MHRLSASLDTSLEKKPVARLPHCPCHSSLLFLSSSLGHAQEPDDGEGEAGALVGEPEGGAWPFVCSQVIPAATVTSLHDVAMWL